MRADSPVKFPGKGALPSKYQEGRVGKFIVPAKPDLIYLGGISQKDVESIREVIEAASASLLPRHRSRE